MQMGKYRSFTSTLAGLLLTLPVLAYDALSPILCDAEMNLFCPPSTSCCPTFKSRAEPDIITGYSCLMSWSTRFPQGPCCPHFEEDQDVSTGCAAGYMCASDFIPSSSLRASSNPFVESKRRLTRLLEGNYCRINLTAHPADNQGHEINNKYETMPRYRTCDSFTSDGVAIYGLSIPLSAATSHKNASSSFIHGDSKYIGKLAYYSNMGQIHADSDITTAVVGVHGSGRDAGTYLCALSAMLPDAATDSSLIKENRNVLVLAPWFTAPEDNLPDTSSSIPFIQWDDHRPIPHTFRYGAESIPDINYNMTVSSFSAMDVLLEHLCNRERFPNLNRIVVAGHSAGAQFVQRWALSSNSLYFGGGRLPAVRVVVANPRSYAYLDKRRFFIIDQATVTDDDDVTPAENDGTLTPFDKYQLRAPSKAEEEGCSEFNKYEWGLDKNEDVPAPYVINNIQQFIDHGNNSALFCRYASRDIVYLSGERDIETLGSQICEEGKEDGYQGPSRRERSERFFASLQVRGKEVCCNSSAGQEEVVAQVHNRHVVKNVAHDHALIFQSREGMQAIFGYLSSFIDDDKYV